MHACMHTYIRMYVPLCSREHNQAMFVLAGAQSSNICARGSTIKRYLCSREHNQAAFVLPGAQMARALPYHHLTQILESQ